MRSIRPAIFALLLAAALGAGVAQAAPTTINVVLSSYKFDPMELDLTHGQAYTLHLTNPSNKAHDLAAKAFFATAAIDPGSAASVRNGAIEVPQGGSVDVTLTPQTAGSYDMQCTHPLHAMLGMKGQIVVR
jgi:plastocyanin